MSVMGIQSKKFCGGLLIHCATLNSLNNLGPLGKNLIFLSPLGIAEILEFSELSVYTEVVLLKTFTQHFELCLYCK